MSRAGLSLLPLVLALCGCMNSQHPYYTADDLVEDESLAGDWSMEQSVPRRLLDGNPVATDPKHESLRLEWEDGVYLSKVSGQPGANRHAADALQPRLRLLKLGHHFFVDYEPEVGFHFLYRIGVVGDRLYVRFNDDQWLRDYLSAHDDVAQTLSYSSDLSKLRAEPPALQAFVLEHIHDPAAWPAYHITQEQTVVEGWLRKPGGLPIGDDGLGGRRQRAYDYWYEVVMRINELALPSRTTRWSDHRRSLAISLLADSLANLPTEGVDPDAAECGTRAARVVGQMAKLLDDETPRNDAEAFVQSLLAAPSDQPAMPTDPIQADAARKIQTEWLACLKQFDTARAKLSKTHGIDFPPLANAAE